ncbi:methionyl-tRNA formyltransferase [Marinomonas agarivorans]|nr:methionyl-tRNA formyltransferase [Marinomonas agarivorans]
MTAQSPHPTTPLRIIFAGTPDFAAASLQALIDNATDKHYDIIGIYTQPDRPSGRGQKLVASPVKQLGVSHSIPVFQPQNFKQKEALQQLADLKADIMVVAAYGIILPQTVLDTPKLGCINVHASLLPRWRGAAPIHRALIAGDKETGITIMQMDAGLDTGDMLLKTSCPITPEDTSGSLHDKLSLQGGECLVTALEAIKAGTIAAEKQDDDQAIYASKLTKQEGELDWSASAIELDLKIRGLSPWPGTYTETEQGVLKIHRAKCLGSADLASKDVPQKEAGKVIAIEKEHIAVATGDGVLAIQEIQLPGSKRLSIRDAMNGKFKTLFQVGNFLGKIT